MRSKSIRVSAAVLILAAASVASNDAHAVLGGELAVESAYPAIRKITLLGTGVCTGTFIAPRTMLTAAHCVVDAMVGGSGAGARLDLSVDGRAPIAYRVHPHFLGHAQDMQSYDVALLEFGADAAYPVARLASRAAQVGDPATIVGYGVVDGVAGIMRVGHNTIADAGFGQLTLISGGTHGHGATGSPGDSGGPLLDQDGELIGSTGRSSEPGVMLGGEPARISSYIDLSEPAVREFIDLSVTELSRAGAGAGGHRSGD